MEISDENIAEIASLLDLGLICFYHRPTGTIESHPDPDDIYFEAELWQEAIDKVEADLENYERFDKMTSREAYQVMEDFAFSLKDINFREKILHELSKRKPFQKFKFLIDNSIYRQNWFDFKEKANIDFVKKQIEATK